MSVNSSRDCLQPLKRLLLDKVGFKLSLENLKEVDSLNFAGLRDQLLAEGPLDVAWIKKASWGLDLAFAGLSHPHQTLAETESANHRAVNTRQQGWMDPAAYLSLRNVHAMVMYRRGPLVRRELTVWIYPCAWIVFSCSRGQVNAAEAEFWRRSQGTRVEYSDRVLGFECGGQQWVNEVCFPAGTLREPNGRDLDYMVSDGQRVVGFIGICGICQKHRSSCGGRSAGNCLARHV